MPSGRGHSTNRTRIQVQKVRIYSSDRWIPLKFFSRVSVGCLDAIEWNRYDTSMPSGRGHSTDTTRVPGQKVRISRSDRWVALKFFHEFPWAVFNGVTWNRYDTPMPSGRGHSTDRTRVQVQKVRIYRSDRCIPVKFFSRVSRGCFGWSSMESVHHADAVRSEPFHRQD